MAPYLRPALWQRRLEAPLMTRFSRLPVFRVLRVSGLMRTVNVRPIEVSGSRYLVALLGDTHWARNLGAAGTGELLEGGSTRTMPAVEIEIDERATAVAHYLATSTCGPTKRLLARRLPDPADQAIFRIE